MQYHLHIPHHVPGKGDEFFLISFLFPLIFFPSGSSYIIIKR